MDLRDLTRVGQVTSQSRSLKIESSHEVEVGVEAQEGSMTTMFFLLPLPSHFNLIESQACQIKRGLFRLLIKGNMQHLSNAPPVVGVKKIKNHDYNLKGDGNSAPNFFSFLFY